MPLILPERQAEYFSREIWTGVIDLNARLKSGFWRKPFFGKNRRRRRQDRQRSNAFASDGQITTHRPCRPAAGSWMATALSFWSNT
jgi:hypothetical protein